MDEIEAFFNSHIVRIDSIPISYCKVCNKPHVANMLAWPGLCVICCIKSNIKKED